MPAAYGYDASSPDVANIIKTEYKILDSYLTRPASLPTILPFSKPQSDQGGSTGIVTFSSFVPLSQRDDPRWKSVYQDLQFQRNLVIDDIRRRTAGEANKVQSLSAKFCQTWQRETHAGRTGNKRQTESINQSRKRKRQGSGQPRENNHSGDDSEEEQTEEDQPHEQEKQLLDHDQEDPNFDVSLDTAFHGSTGGTLTHSEDHNHQEKSFLDACESSAQALQAEINDIEKQQDQIVSELEELVGNLSDLRYGKFQRVSSVVDTGDGDQNLHQTNSNGNITGTVEGNVIEALKSLRQALATSAV